MAQDVSATVRMYRLDGELGDTFLIKFLSDGEKCNVLLDFGSFRNGNKSKERLNKIIKSIKVQTDQANQKIDLVIATHQHNDHVSGFVHCEKDLAKIGVEQVWLSWLDDPKDELSTKIKKSEKQLAQSLKSISNVLAANGNKSSVERINEILRLAGLQDDQPEIPAKGLEVLKNIGNNPCKYLSPGNILQLPNLPKDSVNVYVLGPPRNFDQISDKNPKKNETYDPHIFSKEKLALDFIKTLKTTVKNGFDPDEQEFPFNNAYKIKLKQLTKNVKNLYVDPKNEWRQLKNDAIEDAEKLAFYLHGFTNNCSLVLAFEMVKTGKVLLFAADAQYGNWASWDKIAWDGEQNKFLTDRLLKNTVLYKVGHHGSHNSTLVSALEKMSHPDLVAMITVDQNDPMLNKTVNPWRMPATRLYKRLKEKTNNRVLRMDCGFAEGCHPDEPGKSWKNFEQLPVIDKLFIEFLIRG